MRRTGVFVGLAVLGAVATAPEGAAQTTQSLRLADRPANVEVRDRELIDALRLLQARSGVPIGFSPESIPSRDGVSCACLESSVGSALEELLAGTDLTYVERRSQILILPKSTNQAGEPPMGAVVGVVREPGGGAPVRSARVELRELRRATLTDVTGRFVLLPVPPGEYHVDVDALGYRSVAGHSVTVTEDYPIELALELSPSPLALAEIVVAPGTFGMLENVALSPQTLSREEMDALPQLGEDVLRAMERMPGVATDDISAKMNVRGGNDDELLIMLDGTELFEPYHLKDLDAVLGVVDVGVLRGVSLLAGGLPTEHGDRMSGLLDMRTLQPVGSGARHSIGLSASNVTFRSQGTLANGRGGWLLSGRRGFLDLLLAMASATDAQGSNDELSPSYYDVFAKVELLAGAKHHISVNALLAGDNLDLAEVNPPLERASLGSKWSNVSVWAGWDWDVSPSLDARTVLSGAGLSRLRTGEYISPGSSEVADFADVNDEAEHSFLTLRQDWRIGVRDDLVLKIGGQIRRTGSDYRYTNVFGREFVDAGGAIDVAYDTTSVGLRPSATESSAYVAARVQPLTPLTVEVGVRFDHRTHTSDSDLSPRLQAAIDLSQSTTLRGSWGAQRQSHGVEELSVVDGDTIFFPSELAEQVAIGVQHRFGNGTEARVEAYHRRVSDPRPRYVNVGREIIIFPEIGNDRTRFLPEEGRTRGFEVIFSGPFGARSRWSATYVLAQAEDRLAGEWIPRTLDQRHTTSARWHFEPSDKWVVSAGWQFHTGWPSTPMDFQVDTIPGAGPNERSLLITESPGSINSRRLPAYHRMDLRATRTFDLGRGRLRVFLDVFNVYNRHNLRSYDYAVNLPSGRVVANPGETLLPLLPSFGFTWEF